MTLGVFAPSRFAAAVTLALIASVAVFLLALVAAEEEAEERAIEQRRV